MLASLLTLALAASPTHACAAIWSGIAQGKGFRQDVVADMLHGDASKVAALEAHFASGCEKLPPSAIDCGTSHPGRSLFRECPALAQLFHEAATSSDVAGADIAKLREQGLAREALVNLQALGQAARMLRLRSGPSADFTFPASAGPTSSVDCCTQPAKTCASEPADWRAPTWRALGFAPQLPLRFHYRFMSHGRGREAQFSVTARGDPDCTGAIRTWTVTGKDQGGKFVVSAVSER